MLSDLAPPFPPGAYPLGPCPAALVELLPGMLLGWFCFDILHSARKQVYARGSLHAGKREKGGEKGALPPKATLTNQAGPLRGPLRGPIATQRSPFSWLHRMGPKPNLALLDTHGVRGKSCTPNATLQPNRRASFFGRRGPRARDLQIGNRIGALDSGLRAGPQAPEGGPGLRPGTGPPTPVAFAPRTQARGEGWGARSGGAAPHPRFADTPILCDHVAKKWSNAMGTIKSTGATGSRATDDKPPPC